MADRTSSLFVTLEGLDGSGKSTQAVLLAERLAELGANPLLVREPGGTKLSELVRELLLDPGGEISPRAEMLLFASARAQLVDEVIRPALDSGRVVVGDRFYDSTTAYQGGGRELGDLVWMEPFHTFTTGGLRPRRTYFIDVPVDVASARRGASSDRMEAGGREFYERVRDSYMALTDADPDRVKRVDGTMSPEEVREAIWADLAPLVTELAD